MSHSTIVGGSTASRVINCPGSVALVAQMPPRPSSSYADEGTLLHEIMAELLNNGFAKPDDFLGHRYEDIELTQDMIDEKVRPAMRLLDQVDPEQMMDMYVEFKVELWRCAPRRVRFVRCYRALERHGLHHRLEVRRRRCRVC
jgi:hypothetical protein